jgi:hypothetical protein
MTTLFDFLGDVPLSELPEASAVEPRSGLETYTFEDSLEAKRVIAVVSNGGPARVERFVMRSQGWNGDITAQLHVFSPAGHEVIAVSATREGGGYALQPAKTLRLPAAAAALILVEKRG